MNSQNPYESSLLPARCWSIEHKPYTIGEMMLEITLPGYALYNGLRWEQEIAHAQKSNYKFPLEEYLSVELIKLTLAGLTTTAYFILNQ